SARLSSTSSTSMASAVVVVSRRDQGKKDSRATIYLGIYPNMSAMLVDNALLTGQTYSCAFKIILKVQSLENTKQFIGIFHVETSSVVLHPEDCLLILAVLANLNYCRRTAPGKPNGIRNQVQKHMLY